jgi:hypothetical protein
MRSRRKPHNSRKEHQHPERPPRPLGSEFEKLPSNGWSAPKPPSPKAVLLRAVSHAQFSLHQALCVREHGKLEILSLARANKLDHDRKVMAPMPGYNPAKGKTLYRVLSILVTEAGMLFRTANPMNGTAEPWTHVPPMTRIRDVGVRNELLYTTGMEWPVIQPLMVALRGGGENKELAEKAQGIPSKNDVIDIELLSAVPTPARQADKKPQQKKKADKKQKPKDPPVRITDQLPKIEEKSPAEAPQGQAPQPVDGVLADALSEEG